MIMQQDNAVNNINVTLSRFPGSQYFQHYPLSTYCNFHIYLIPGSRFSVEKQVLHQDFHAHTDKHDPAGQLGF